ncbi:dUTP diphosphatase [Bacillus cytotoxicus]|uniref:dUTP diphosphatase n=1 Tax=Bacillus cytotoxicus TaxID=580165 RepID=UPI0035CB3848
MNLTKLFDIQAGLKKHIGYKGEDKFPKMMLAMLVEFMECANDWQGFKYWKKQNKPKETLLEEYVDGWHFVLETGLDLLENDQIIALPKEVSIECIPFYNKRSDIVMQYKELIRTVFDLESEVDEGCDYLDVEYQALVEQYLLLGELLGFTEEQIEQAYMKKNRVNHQRQDEGY